MNNALINYDAILAGRQKPRYKQTDLQPLVDRSHRMLSSCRLCSRLCEADRHSGELGWCEVGDRLSVASTFDHVGEEPFLVPSFTIFFNSCTFGCEFCQNWDISQDRPPRWSSVEDESELAKLIGKHSYCRNINFVGGEPTLYLPFILKTLVRTDVDLPIVWNSNFYMSEEAMDMIAEIADLYLADFKFGNDSCARRLAKVNNYSEVVRRNLRVATESSDVLIRHLVMPGHIDCCSKPVITFIADNLGDRVLVNLMDQYHPAYHAAEHAELNRRLRAEEFDQVVEFTRETGLSFIS